MFYLLCCELLKEIRCSTFDSSGFVSTSLNECLRFVYWKVFFKLVGLHVTERRLVLGILLSIRRGARVVLENNGVTDCLVEGRSIWKSSSPNRNICLCLEVEVGGNAAAWVTAATPLVIAILPSAPSEVAASTTPC